LGSFASFWHDTEQKTALPVSKSVSLAKYPGANELRFDKIPGSSKNENEKTKQNKTKKQRHAEHKKPARELVRDGP